MDYDKRLIEKLTPKRVAAKIAHESRRALAPILMRRSPLQGRSFDLWGDSYPYFLHRHNSTWRNERAVELAVASRFIRRARGNGMEFGNVLAHYGLSGWPVIDKFERATGVMNIDIVDYEPKISLDWIVSISTLEHVGWDERPRDPQKSLLAFGRLCSFLKPGGSLLVTVPLGHNATFDEAIRNGLPVERQTTMVREPNSTWRPSPSLEERPYDRSRGAGSVWIAVVSA